MNPRIAVLLDAAHSGDLASVAARIDWPASGIGGFVRALWNVEPAERGRLAETGLRNLLTEGSTRPIPLGPLAALGTGGFEARPATPAEAGQVGAELRVPDLPPEVGAAERASLHDLAHRVDVVDEIWVLERDGYTSMALVAGPDIHGVAVLRHLQ